MTEAFVASYVFLWLLVLLMLAACLAIARELALVRARVGPEPGALAITEGPKIGSALPQLRGDLLGGGRFELEPRHRPTMLVFISAHCDACRDLLPELVKFVNGGAGVGVFVVGLGRASDYETLASLYEIPVPLVMDDDGAIAGAFDVRTTPLALVADEEGIVRSKGIVNTRDHLVALTKYEMTIRRVGLELSKRQREGSVAPEIASSGSGFGGPSGR